MGKYFVIEFRMVLKAVNTRCTKRRRTTCRESVESLVFKTYLIVEYQSVSVIDAEAQLNFLAYERGFIPKCCRTRH